MPGLGGLAGLSGAYSGYTEGVADEATARAKKYAIDIQQAGDAAFGRTLMLLNSSQQQQPQPGQPPMPPPGGAPPMPGQPTPGGPPPQMPPQMPMQQGQQQPMPQARPPMPVQPGGAPPPPMPQQPIGGAPAGPPQMPGGGQPGGPTLDWRVIFQKVRDANPQAPPQVLAAAVDKFLPLMSQMSQMEWREKSLMLREQMEGMKESYGMQLEQLRQSGRYGLEGQREAGRSGLEAQRQGGRMDLHPTAEAIQRLLQNNPDATPTEIMDVVRAGHPQSATEFKAGQQGQAVKSFVSQLDDAIGTIQDSQKGGVPVTGIGGTLSRGAEFVGGMVGADTGTTASDFQTKIRALQQQWPRMIAGTTRLSADERAHVEEIIKGLGTFTSAPQAASALQQVKKIIQQRYGEGEGSKQSSGVQGGQPLKALTDDVKKKIVKLQGEGFSRDDVEDWLRKRGYDPGSD
jgi:hypothetical protein